MNRSLRTPALLVMLMAVVTLLTVISSGVANAASTPPTTWGPVNVAPHYSNTVTAPNGEVTIGCDGSGQDLITYNTAGTVVRQIPRTSMIDGVNDCIGNVVVDKNATIYGVPLGYNAGGSLVRGPNLLAYSGNTLKWKYPVVCTDSQPAQYAVGGDGNIYATNRTSDGVVHLIGLTPTLAAGHTVPTKVLDVNTGTDCTQQLFPYKDGIMLYASSNGEFSFYSYNGTLLTQSSSIPNASDARVNADGKLFSYAPFTSNGVTSINVAKFDPNTGQTTWTTQASSPGANTQFAWLYPLAGGGVVAVVLEQRMDNGVPYTPTQWVYTMTTLDATGTKVFSTQLPTTNGTDSANPVIVPEVNGKYLLVRQLETPTTPTGTYPPTEPTTYLNVIDPTTNAVTYATMWQGNTDSSGGASLYGYKFDYDGTSGPITGPGTAYLQVRCYDSCPGGDNALNVYPVPVSGLGMDYPRGAVLTAYPRSSTAYEALGDSFSSGESLSPFMAGTDLPAVNTCHRSSQAYPALIAGTSAKIPALGANGFRACSGAVTTNLWDVAQWNEGIQTDRYPDVTTKLVTLTIGGNDIGFSDFGNACATPFSSCDVGTPAYTNAINHINGDLAGKLTAAYQNILTMAPNAKVYVIGYPQVVANKLVTDPVDTRCPTLAGGNTRYGNARAARSIVTQVDAMISHTVGAVSNSRLHYVPADGSTSPFTGHEVCGTSTTSWFQNINQWLSNPAYVFHPNALGQGGYATIAKNAINAG